MRYLYIVSFTILLSLFDSSSIKAQSKSVYWVHGMNGKDTDFAYFADHFNTNYFIVSYRCDYGTSNGISKSANNLRSEINYDPTEKNIVITHSMGGVNSLYMYKYLDKDRGSIGGIISFDAPFNGVYLANNVDNGVMTSIINEANDKGLKGA